MDTLNADSLKMLVMVMLLKYSHRLYDFRNNLAMCRITFFGIIFSYSTVKMAALCCCNMNRNSHVRLSLAYGGKLLFCIVSGPSSQIAEPLAFSSLFPSINIFVVLKGHLCILPSLPSFVMNECNYQAWLVGRSLGIL